MDLQNPHFMMKITVFPFQATKVILPRRSLEIPKFQRAGISLPDKMVRDKRKFQSGKRTIKKG